MLRFNGKEEMGQEEEEEERESLMTNSSYYGGSGGGTAAVTVVEYMVSSMSKELLCKFPDNSAFDFDYSQSSIWSPLLPHPSNPSPSPSFPDLQRKLCYDDGGDGLVWRNGGETAATVVRKLTEKIAQSTVFSCFQINQKMSKKKMKRRKSLNLKGFAPNSTADPVSTARTPSKGLAKVLKAASRQFKKTMKKKGSASRLKLSNGFSHTTNFF